MTMTFGKFARFASALAASLALVACGGGGGGGDPAPAPVPTPDARNGDYVMYAANAHPYTLSLNFDAKTYRVVGNGLDQSGAIGGDAAAGFFFQPTGVIAGFNTARFHTAPDAMIGNFRLPEGVVPFVAARSFVTTSAEAAGNYNFLTRTVSTPGPNNTGIFNGEITAGGQVRTCNDLTIHHITTCPAASVVPGTLTVAGTEYTATTPNGPFTFRIARIGTDKVFLRASASTATSRRFWIGTLAASGFSSGNFSGGNTDGNWSTFSLSSTAHSAGIQTQAGATLTRSGASAPLTSLPSMLRLSGGIDAFAIRAFNLGVIAATRDNAAAPGFMEIGRSQ
jgi:hypothetical protein